MSERASFHRGCCGGCTASRACLGWRVAATLAKWVLLRCPIPCLAARVCWQCWGVRFSPRLVAVFIVWLGLRECGLGGTAWAVGGAWAAVLSGGRHGRREAIGRQALTYGGGTQANVTNTSVFWFQLLTRERALYVLITCSPRNFHILYRRSDRPKGLRDVEAA